MMTRDLLAEYAHQAWAGWMKYMFSKGTLNPDGTITIPDWAVTRWTRQMLTDYADLPESEKVSDLEEADKMITIARIAELETELMDIKHLTDPIIERARRALEKKP
jgi:hypothetical protein